jgi:hypothetical protein
MAKLLMSGQASVYMLNLKDLFASIKSS